MKVPSDDQGQDRTARRSKMKPSKPKTINRLNAMIESLKEESERGCVIVGQSYLDEEIQLLVAKKLSSMTATGRDIIGPLASSGYMQPLDKAPAERLLRLAVKLGVAKEFVISFHTHLRHIRNEFSHTTSKIIWPANEVETLISTLPQDYRKFVATLANDLITNHGYSGLVSRARFMVAIARVYIDLMSARAHITRKTP